MPGSNDHLGTLNQTNFVHALKTAADSAVGKGILKIAIPGIILVGDIIHAKEAWHYQRTSGAYL